MRSQRLITWVARLTLALAATTAFSADAVAASPLNGLYERLSVNKFVDLTHAFEPAIPHRKGAPAETVKSLITVKKRIPKPRDGSGFPPRVLAILP